MNFRQVVTRQNKSKRSVNFGPQFIFRETTLRNQMNLSGQEAFNLDQIKIRHAGVLLSTAFEVS